MKNAIISAIVAALVASGSTLAATGYISGAKIKPHTLAANRLTANAVKSLQAAATSQPRALAAAVNSTLDYETVTGVIDHLPQTVTATCPAGYVAVGGGYSTSSNVNEAAIPQNGKTTDSTGWAVTMGVGSAFPDTAQLTVDVSCEPSAG